MQVYQIEITCEGNYTFSTCSNTNWDTFLYLSTAPCGGTTLALNDDNCGLQSSITESLSIGTYYLNIEGYATSSLGSFDLEISTPCVFNPLPIVLIDFTGENEANFNKLNWNTASEINNDYFILERSKENIDFEEIANIDGSGNQNSHNSYFYYDYQIDVENYYYRLKQVDFDGSITTHKTIFIRKNTELKLEIYPNPVHNKLIIRLKDDFFKTSLIIKNSIGQEISAKKILIGNESILDLSGYQKGIYFLEIEIGGRIVTKKIIKE